MKHDQEILVRYLVFFKVFAEAELKKMFLIIQRVVVDEEKNGHTSCNAVADKLQKLDQWKQRRTICITVSLHIEEDERDNVMRMCRCHQMVVHVVHGPFIRRRTENFWFVFLM